MGAVRGSVLPLAGRYRLLSVVGRGGMGTVWRAHDEVLDREVAVKELTCPERMGDGDRVELSERMRAEAHASAVLDHPGALTVHDVIEDDGRPWIVMELLHGVSLKELIATAGPLPPSRAAYIGLQVLSVLSAAHARGLLHRDVKPSNVLLTDSGRVVLTDFGLAVSAAESARLPLEGSPAYVSPEAARAAQGGGSPLTGAADLWSLGATLYAAVEGRPPYARDGALASLLAVLIDDHDPPEHAGPLRPAIDGLLRKDPAERLTAPEATRLLQSAATPGPWRRGLSRLRRSHPAAPYAWSPRPPGWTGDPPPTDAAARPHRTTSTDAPTAPTAAAVGTEEGLPVTERGPGAPSDGGLAAFDERRSGAGQVPGASGEGGLAASGERPGGGEWSRGVAGWPRRVYGRMRERSGRGGMALSVAGGMLVVAGLVATGVWSARLASAGSRDALLVNQAGAVAGTVRYREGGYSVDMPIGWTRVTMPDGVYWQDPAGPRYARITPASGDPLSGLRWVEGHSHLADYHRLRLEQTQTGAAWEYTWGGGMRALEDRQGGYDLLFVALDSRWTPSTELFQPILSSFRAS